MSRPILNTDPEPRSVRRLIEHLTTAGEQLYLVEMDYERDGRPFPVALKRARTAVGAERRRLEREMQAARAARETERKRSNGNENEGPDAAG